VNLSPFAIVVARLSALSHHMRDVSFVRAGTDRLRLAGILVLLAALPAGGTRDAAGIIIRHDRDDARYRALYADGDRFRAVATIGGGLGMVIDPYWVVTAAHVVTNVSPFDPTVVIAGKRYRIERVIMHPGWPAGGDVRVRAEVVDLALIRLREPVTDIEPMLLYEGDDEVGTKIIFVGSGQTGTGLTGPVSHDQQWRAATNTVEEASDNWLDFIFSEPPNATDLEGISGPGDSGGPALIERDGRLVLLGVSSGNDGGGAGFCRYGSTEYYARISTKRAWIGQTMAEYEQLPDDAKPQFAPVVQFAEKGWPQTRVAAAAAAFVSALGDPPTMQAFSAAHRSKSARENISDEDYAAFWHRNAPGAGTPVKYVAYGENRLSVLVRLTSSDGEIAGWRTFDYTVSPEPPHHLGPTRMSVVPPPFDER